MLDQQREDVIEVGTPPSAVFSRTRSPPVLANIPGIFLRWDIPIPTDFQLNTTLF
jgi:hypothetical protein